MFEWDEQKRQANIKKHGLDFEDAKLIFDGPIIEASDKRFDYPEPRMVAYGKVEGVVVFVVYAWRGGNRRIISARKAGTHEKERYHAQIATQGASDEK